MSTNCGNAALLFTSPPCGKQHYKKGRNKRRCSSTAAKKKYLCFETNGQQNNCNSNGSNPNAGDKKKNFMEDVWKVMTPDMLQKLVEILVEDFHMSRAEACAFIQQQRDSSKAAQKAANGKCPCAPDLSPAIPSLQVRNAMIKEFIDLLTCKLSDFVALMLCEKKSKRQFTLTRVIAASMNELVGIKDDSCPLAKLNAFLADKLSIWLDNVFEDEICKGDKDNGKNGGGSGNNSSSSVKNAKEEAPPAEEPAAEEPAEEAAEE